MSASDWLNPIGDALQSSWDYWTGQPMVPAALPSAPYVVNATPVGGSMSSPAIVPPSVSIGGPGYDLSGFEGGGIGFNSNVGIPGGLDAGFQITATNPSGTTLGQSLVKAVTGGSGGGTVSTVLLLAGAAIVLVLVLGR